MIIVNVTLRYIMIREIRLAVKTNVKVEVAKPCSTQSKIIVTCRH